MPDATLLQEVGDALNRAEAEGYQRGYAQATQDFYGENAAFLFANIFGDAMEAAAGRLSGHDAAFAGKLHQFAAVLRASVTPPRVASHSPVTDATLVPVGAPITATFDLDMDPSSFTTNSFAVGAASGGPPLNAAVSYDVAKRTATLTPKNGLTPGVLYRVTIEGVSSAQGRAMPEPCTWTFTAQ